MKSKTKYASIAGVCFIVHITLLYGVYSLYMVITKIANMMNSNNHRQYDELLQYVKNPLISGSKMLFIGFVAMIVLIIFLLVYFIYESRSRAIFMGLLISFVCVFVIYKESSLMQIGMFDFETMIGQILYGNPLLVDGFEKSAFSFLMITTIATLYHTILLLQSVRILRIPLLDCYMPETIESEDPQTVGQTTSLETSKKQSTQSSSMYAFDEAEVIEEVEGGIE